MRQYAYMVIHLIQYLSTLCVGSDDTYTVIHVKLKKKAMYLSTNMNIVDKSFYLSILVGVQVVKS